MNKEASSHPCCIEFCKTGEQYLLQKWANYEKKKRYEDNINDDDSTGMDSVSTR